jgi:hypothetical protein
MHIIIIILLCHGPVCLVFLCFFFVSSGTKEEEKVFKGNKSITIIFLIKHTKKIHNSFKQSNYLSTVPRL